MRLLQAFITDNGYTPTAAARAIGISHVTMLDYLSGEKRPSDDRRDAIAIWTGGAVAREAWRTEEERVVLAAVAPAELKPTGTGEG